MPPFALFVHSFIFINLLSQTITKANAEQKHCTEHEKSLLLELRNQLVFDSSISIKLVQWNNQSDDSCSWSGVGCNGAGHVISLLLGYEGISGGLNESSSLFSLEYLEELDLSYNSLEGSEVPRDFSRLTHLSYLFLRNCSLKGHFPEIGNLTQLEYVYLSNNFFSGSISSFHFEALSNVGWIDLSYNALSGTIPTSIFGNLPLLLDIDLSNNQFSGQVGEFPIVNVPTRLSHLDLSSNRLESPIPNYFSNLQSLEYLYLSQNLFNHTIQLEKILSLPILMELDLSGNSVSLPSSIPSSSNYFHVRRSSLNVLDLSNNKIAGEIPSWIWDMELLRDLNLSCNMLVGLQKPYIIPASLDVLDLHSNKLRGEFPSSLLRRTRYVDYSNNGMFGSIPTSICNATYLEFLDLSSNNLNGTIPDCIFQNLGNLSVLNLGRNNITGQIPDKFSPSCSLRSFDLSNNNLVGDIPLSLAECSALTVLNLSNNKLSRTIPTSLITILPSLAVLNLGRNIITGPIPNFTAQYCPLQYLVLVNNNLIGEVPQSLGNCNMLQVMNVGSNRLEGSFPCMLPSSLQVLVLRSNRFHGDITCRKNQSWPNLQIIDIASNHFSGYLNPLNLSTWRGMMRDTVTKLSYKALDFTIRDNWVLGYYREEVALTVKGVEHRLVKIWPDFTSIDFSSNNFQGDIPDSIGVLDGLYLLNLSHNSFTGTIPKSYGMLRQLGALDLSINRLTGKIPRKIAWLTFLAVMNVSHNKLIGEIPVSTQIQSFSADCFEGNAGLCGPPLNISCPSTGRVSPPKQGKEESEREEIEWEYVFVAAGYAVGLGSFSWLLLFCRSFRHKYFEKVEDVFDTIFERCKHKKRNGRGRGVSRNQVTRQ